MYLGITNNCTKHGPTGGGTRFSAKVNTFLHTLRVGDKRIYNSGMYKFIIFYNCQSIFLHLGDEATVREPNETASEEEIQEEGEVIARHYCHLHKDKDKDKDNDKNKDKVKGEVIAGHYCHLHKDKDKDKD